MIDHNIESPFESSLPFEKGVETVTPLTNPEIRAVLPNLPSPLAHYRMANAVFEIYCVKEMFNPFWRDPVLKNLFLSARNSYSVYGVRPSLDQYDEKAAIYLVRVIYPYVRTPKHLVEEWLSIRMVPGDGHPLGGGELEIFFYDGKPISFWVKERFSSDGDDFWQYIGSSSRMCGIHPYFQSAAHEEELGGTLSEKHKYTNICFALIHLQFLLDYPPQKFPYRYITAIIRDELMEKGLSFRKNGLRYGPTFTPAFQFLKLSGRKELRLDRNVYAYAFPLYWFDRNQLLVLLNDLVQFGKLPPDVLDLRALGNILTIDGPIPRSTLTGADFRKLVDERVDTVPDLKITSAKAWYTSLQAMLKSVGIEMPGVAALIDAYPQYPET